MTLLYQTATDGGGGAAVGYLAWYNVAQLLCCNILLMLVSWLKMFHNTLNCIFL